MLMKLFAFLNVDIPWIAWLAYRGEMVSPQATGERVLSIWHANYLIDAANARDRVVYYNREREIEAIRQARFPSRVSRLSGLYFFRDLASARRAGQRWDGHFREEHLAEIEICRQLRLSQYDSDWISNDMLSGNGSWIHSYLAGQPRSGQPLWEILLEGRGLILGTRLRERAYQTVAKTWPQSLALLELSRVAVELDSDLGLICPILTTHGNITQLQPRLNFCDARNPVFLTKFRQYAGPKNTADLNAKSELTLPDLAEFSVQFRL